MNRATQIYYNAIFGALGGLIGWYVVGSFPTGAWNILLAYTFVGAGIGLFIGATTGLVPGLVVQRSLPRAVTGTALGGAAGALSGMFGLLLGEGTFLMLGGGILGRSLGWTLLGLFLGMGEGFLSLKFRRASYGAIGGILGGLIGGLLYETMTQLYIKESAAAQVLVGAVGLILLGACLGGIIPISIELIASVVGKGTLQVLTGKRQGLVVSVIDSVTLGSSDSCDVYLPGDGGIAKKHAVVHKGPRGFLVRDLGTPNGTLVGQRPIPTQEPGQPLRPGDQIQLGTTRVLFR